MPKREADALFGIATEDQKAFDLLARSHVSFAIACFHAQQAVEKYIKSKLSSRDIKYPFTHDLEDLYLLCQHHDLTPPVDLKLLEDLNPFAVKQRYDLPSVSSIDDKDVSAMLQQLQQWCKED